LRAANTENKKQLAADELKQVSEESKSNVFNELIDARSRLKPVKTSSVSPSKEPGMIQQQVKETEDRKTARGVNQTQAGSKPVIEGRRPSKDATASAAEVAIPSEFRAANGNAKLPPKLPAAAAGSKSFAPSPPLPARAREHSSSPQRNAVEASVRTLDTRTERGGNTAKAPAAVVANETGSRVNDRHTPSKDASQHTAAVRDSTPTRLTDTKQPGTCLY